MDCTCTKNDKAAAALAREITNACETLSDAYAREFLIRLVGHLGGWRGPLLRSAVELVVDFKADPTILEAMLDCDPSFALKREYHETFWAILLRENASDVAFGSLMEYFELPHTLYGAPFEWFMAHCSGLSPERLARLEIPPPTTRPELAIFVSRMLEFEFREGRFDRACKIFIEGGGQYVQMRTAGVFKIADRNRIQLAIATYARWVMRYMNYDQLRAKHITFSWESIVVNEENHHWFRQRTLVAEIARLWACACQHSIEVMTEFVDLICEWLPELVADETFRRKLELHVRFLKNLDAAHGRAIIAGLDRLCGGRAPRPIMVRDYEALCPLGPASAIDPVLVSLLSF